MENWITLIGIVLTFLGGGSCVVSWLLFRRQSKQIKDAEASIAATKADSAEFNYLKERLIFAEQQNLEKEKRFAEQTAVVRQLNADKAELWQRLLDEQKERAKLGIELAVKRCDRKKCGDRLPPNGY